MKIQDKVKRIIEDNPRASRSNTELYIAYLENELREVGLFLPTNIADVIRKSKPEAITRARRAIKKPTADQLAEAIRYREEYKPDNPNPYFNN
jgi:hypothetical protein